MAYAAIWYAGQVWGPRGKRRLPWRGYTWRLVGIGRTRTEARDVAIENVRLQRIPLDDIRLVGLNARASRLKIVRLSTATLFEGITDDSIANYYARIMHAGREGK